MRAWTVIIHPIWPRLMKSGTGSLSNNCRHSLCLIPCYVSRYFGGCAMPSNLSTTKGAIQIIYTLRCLFISRWHAPTTSAPLLSRAWSRDLWCLPGISWSLLFCKNINWTNLAASPFSLGRRKGSSTAAAKWGICLGNLSVIKLPY